jgi:sugar phosphate isomerase/epimerase
MSQNQPQNQPQLCVFSKHLAGIPLDQTARRLRAMNIEAIDLTVRSGGHVEPDRAALDLPTAGAILAREGVKIAMITTNITDARDKHTEAILRTAAAMSIGYYKLGYFSYGGFGSLKKQRAEVAARFADLAELNKSLGIKGGYHNHSHNFFGAVVADIGIALENVDPQWLGLYFDAAHAGIEGGSSAWLMGLDALRERVLMLAVKDYFWSEERGYGGGRRFKAQFCPPDIGNVPWPKVFACLKELNFSGPISLHSEYQGASSFRDLSTDEVFEQTARDADYFRPLLHDVGLML